MFETTPLPGLLLYKPKVFKDDRGHFYESYNQNHFKHLDGFLPFVQDNRSLSYKNTLRGFHFQRPPYEQAKLVGVLKGAAFDVAVDLRPHSSTFGKWFGVHLSEEYPQFIYIPRGFAHGFLTLSDSTEFFYKVDNYYNKEAESGIRYDDGHLAVTWPHITAPLILSEKDRSLPSFNEFVSSLKK